MHGEFNIYKVLKPFQLCNARLQRSFRQPSGSCPCPRNTAASVGTEARCGRQTESLQLTKKKGTKNDA